MLLTYLNPAHAKPPNPTATVIKATISDAEVEWAAANRKIVWHKKAPQLKIFLTYKSNKDFFLKKKKEKTWIDNV